MPDFWVTSQQLPALAAVVKRKLDEGDRCPYLHNLPMAGIRCYLARIGIDFESAIAKTCLILSSDELARYGRTLHGWRKSEPPSEGDVQLPNRLRLQDLFFL